MNISDLYDRLYDYYGDPHWWPAESPYEVIVGAVLTQNTAWKNVVKAIARFDGKLSPADLLALPSEDLSEIIRPAGFFNQKAGYLKAVTKWYASYGFDVATVRREPLHKLRDELLSVKGVGNETADSILLYAFDLPTFVVDAYTARLCARLNVNVGKGYAQIKKSFEAALPQSSAAYNLMHALIVVHSKQCCRKKPMCAECPLADACEDKCNRTGR